MVDLEHTSCRIVVGCHLEFHVRCEGSGYLMHHPPVVIMDMICFRQKQQEVTVNLLAI